MILKNSLRQLFKSKLFSLLNILGLTIGISSCWVIYKYVSYELSYERGLSQKEDIYRLLTHFKTEDREELFSGVSRPIYFYLKREDLGLDGVVAQFRFNVSNIRIPAIPGQEQRYEEPSFEEFAGIETDASYFDMVNYHWLAGNQKTALQEPHQVVLTASRAAYYFPGLKPDELLGRTIIYNDSLKRQVAGIVADLDYPSEFSAKEFLFLQEREKDKRVQSWTSTNGADKVYLLSKDINNLNRAIAVLQKELEEKWHQAQQERELNFSFNRKLEIMPLKDSHYAAYMKESFVDKTSLKVIYSLITIGIFLLLLACINYINLTTARLPQRNKEIGIRKTLGSSNRSLMLQMLLETSLIVALSAILSIVVSDLGLRLLGDLIPDSVKSYQNFGLFILFMTAILGSTILIAGLYPAWMMSRVNPTDIFRSKGFLKLGKERLSLRKAMIVFQFIIAQVFIVGALVVGQQLKFVVQTDMGFNKDAVILTDIPYKIYQSENFQTKKMSLLEEIRRIPGIEGVTMGETPLNKNVSSGELSFSESEDKDPIKKTVFYKVVDSTYLDFYAIKLLAGTALTASDTSNGYLINETAVKAFGFQNPQAAIGKMLRQVDQQLPIVGVVKDFHARDFYIPIDPMALSFDQRQLDQYNYRLRADRRKEWPAIIEQVHQAWNKFFPTEEFKYSFYDDTILSFYKKEQQLYKLTNVSTAIAILISCLGLFGLATLTAFQRAKEIGIRKVMGASVSGIISLLSKDFIKIILLAILIASPIVWWIIRQWLNDFTYRIEISWIPFVVGAIIALLAAVLTIGYQSFKAATAKPVDSLKDE